ncbi:MAG: hypothetical protein IH936_08705 [Acidobacteria bacterium]|nr:hypothetical protein [Acidobacteriota bacterium]
MTIVEMAEVAELGYKDFLDRQLHPATIDDGGFEDALNDALPTLAMTPYEIYTSGDDFRAVIELVVLGRHLASTAPSLQDGVLRAVSIGYGLQSTLVGAPKALPISDLADFGFEGSGATRRERRMGNTDYRKVFGDSEYTPKTHGVVI